MSVTLIRDAVVWMGRTTTGAPVPTSHAIAFSQEGVLAVGDTALRIPADEIVDGGGGFVCPGFGDGHVHAIFGGLEPQLAPVRDCRSADEIAAAVGRWAADHPDVEWIRGEGFDHTLAPDGVFHASWLDRYVPDRPVVLRATDYHTVWVNSEALRQVGYVGHPQQPHDGEIVLDAVGSPTGTLREWGAWLPVYAMMPPPSAGDLLTALDTASHTFASAGITWVQDAWVEPDDVEVWLRACEAGAITFRADLALRADPNTWRDQLEGFAMSRREVRERGNGRVTAETIKFFADGVMESGTAALIEGYCDCPHSVGLPNWRPEELDAAVAAIDALGFNAHIHAIGDAAARSALDAVEFAITTNGARDRRPVIAHAQLVDRVDLRRFNELGVVANFEPYWAKFDSWQVELTEPRLGVERTGRQFMIRSVLDSGAPVSFGSDWPVTTHEPLSGIQIAVTRQMPDGGDRTWMPDECITVEDGLVAYTSGSAHQRGDSRGGHLRPGARADVVLLDRDPRSSKPQEIGEVRVISTWVDGMATYRRPASSPA